MNLPHGPTPTRRLLSTGVTVLVSVAVLAAVVAAFGVLLGWRALITYTDRMEPGIDSGALLLTRPVDAQDVEVGDVVSIRTAGGDRLTLRVVSAKRTGGDDVVLTATQDRSETDDARTFSDTRFDVVYLDVPVLGRVVDAVVSLPGLLVVFILALLLNMRRRTRSRSRSAPSGLRG